MTAVRLPRPPPRLQTQRGRGRQKQARHQLAASSQVKSVSAAKSLRQQAQSLSDQSSVQRQKPEEFKEEAADLVEHIV